MKRNNFSQSGILVFATRTIFVCLLVISSSQITCTVVFMLLCRRASKEVVLTLHLSDDPCGGQGLPVYIASAILLVTIFGFGCVGRRSTSIALLILSVCDLGLSVFIAVSTLERNVTQRTQLIASELEPPLTSCSSHDFTNDTSSSSASQSKCLSFLTLLSHFCPDIPSEQIRVFDNSINVTNCSSVIEQALTDIKLEYFPVAVSLHISSSFFYTLLSILLYFVQFKDKQLPTYERREHILSVPEFTDCPTHDENVVYEDMGPKLTIKLCILNVLWCRCHVLFKHQYCCGVSRRKKKDVYEFTTLPVKHTPDEQEESDPTASVSQLV